MQQTHSPHGLRTGQVHLSSEHRIRRRPCSRPRNPRLSEHVRRIVRGQTLKHKLTAAISHAWGSLRIRVVPMVVGEARGRHHIDVPRDCGGRVASKGPRCTSGVTSSRGHGTWHGRAACATDRAPLPLRDVFDVSTQQHRSPVGAASCRTRPASRSGRVGHAAHRLRAPGERASPNSRHGASCAGRDARRDVSAAPSKQSTPCSPAAIQDVIDPINCALSSILGWTTSCIH
jgi:hypothetical protein